MTYRKKVPFKDRKEHQSKCEFLYIDFYKYIKKMYIGKSFSSDLFPLSHLNSRTPEPLSHVHFHTGF